MAVSLKSVGASGRRRIVPMMGIDFIAGNIESKQEIIPRYGGRTPSIGGRTRKWSNINFMQVNSSIRRSVPLTQNQMRWHESFKTATNSQRATMDNLAVRVAIQNDWINKAVRAEVPSSQYATIRGWVTAVRIAQIQAGVPITDTTNTWEFTA